MKNFFILFIVTFATFIFWIFWIFIDETPSDVHDRLVPQIAKELIEHHSSSRVKGITPRIKEVLEKHSIEGIEYKKGSPNGSSDTGISFYSRKDKKRFLAIGLNLNAAMDGYRVTSISESDKSDHPPRN